MIVALSGTPGVGKTSVSALLKNHGYTILSLNEIALDNKFIKGVDKERNSTILDIDRINEYISKAYDTEKLVFIEGHASHLLKIIDKVILLRCHPTLLHKRLEEKGWKKEKIKENVEAEILDIILCEAVEFFSEQDIYEIDTTKKTVEAVSSSIIKIIQSDFKPLKNYTLGKIDWSEEILKDYIL